MSIEVGDPAQFNDAVSEALTKVGYAPGTAVAVHGSNVCYPIENLIKHIVRAFLKARIGQYLIDLPLPSSIDLFEGYAVGDLKAVVCHNYLIAYGKGQVSAKQVSRKPPSVTSAHGLQLKAHDDGSIVIASANGSDPDAPEPADQPEENDFYNATASKGGYLLLWVSRGLFQAAADKNLNIDDGDSDSDSSGAINWAWSWWMKLRNRGINFIQPNRLGVEISLQAGGSAKASIDTHCGPIGLGTSLDASLVPEPTALSFRLLLDSVRRKIRIHADSKPGAILVKPTHKWDLIGWVLSAILTAVGTTIWNVIDFALNFFAIDVADLPERFPGTDLKYKTFGFNTSFWGADHYMITLGIDFE